MEKHDKPKRRQQLRRTLRLLVGVGLGALLAELCGYLPPDVALPCKVISKVAVFLIGGQ